MVNPERTDFVNTIITSPPYWGLRDYGAPGQIGLERTLEEHLTALADTFRDLRRILHPEGTLWLNYGSMYSSDGGAGTGGNTSRKDRTHQQRNVGHGPAPGFPSKNLILADAMLALALQKDGWILRAEIIWQKPNAMPESSRDRPGRDHEKVYLFSKSAKYFYNREAVLEPFRSPDYNRARDRSPGGDPGARVSEGRALRTVWSIPSQPYRGAHFATFPLALAERCILLGSKPGDLVLDPFTGSGTTAAAAIANRRRFLGFEINPDYVELAMQRVGTCQRQSSS
jgi:DNA modification methylase